jgi:hypothetical protein
MNQDLEILISKVELSEDREHLYLHTRNYKDCNCLWAQLAGQALDRTEGHKPILYNMPEEPPESLILEIEADTDQIVLLLKYLENDLKDQAFLPKGTTEHILEQIAHSEKSSYASSPSAKK